MGSSFSLLTSEPDGSLPSQSKPGLGDLPEGCVALILEYLEPQEICKLARLNRAFRGASWADFVWESKLPSNYEGIVRKVFGDSVGNLGKREIFAKLCRPNTFDKGTKKVWLDKSTGGVCMSISSKGLAITGIDDRRYWNYIPTEESRLQLGKAYKRFGRRICNLEHIHGWDIKPVRFQLWTSDGQNTTSHCFLGEPGKWKIYHVGDFVVDKSNAATKIKFSMTQIDCTHTKGGLCLDSVLIYPSECRERLKHF
ncbi:F-box protein PP2-A12 isoform X2 [Ziziphus jujuba]|uniref:F-box protein PP2-A12 isoform X2 n=1 Tax=Ziziphus jujuba TaxID=326968 RepID=A0A6P4AK18_ZIZJJ|nr:F-box protein PP2-A12 isoform X2 [Ziziphus jujuba]